MMQSPQTCQLKHFQPRGNEIIIFIGDNTGDTFLFPCTLNANIYKKCRLETNDESVML